MTASLTRFESGPVLVAANWLLFGVCALLLIRLGIVLVDGVAVDYQPLPFTSSEPLAATLPESDWGMFGDPTETDHGFEQPLPQTPLSLRLHGVVTGERGHAVIMDGEGNEGVYRAGDEVPGQAEVVTIQPRRVVLERDGTREALELPGAEWESGRRAGSGANNSAARAADNKGLASGVGIGSLASMTSRLSLDPEALARRITILPVAGGGFRVRAGRDAAIFTQLGFHANDIVLAINGDPVDNQSDVRDVFKSINPGEPLAITVRRGDDQVVLRPDLSNPGGAKSR